MNDAGYMVNRSTAPRMNRERLLFESYTRLDNDFFARTVYWKFKRTYPANNSTLPQTWASHHPRPCEQ
jgi:hypothetical protein